MITWRKKITDEELPQLHMLLVEIDDKLLMMRVMMMLMHC